MPRKSSNSRKPQNQPDHPSRDVKELFDSLRPHFPVTVQQICAIHYPRLQQADFEDFVEEIDLLLREDDYSRLRSFHGDSALETWLFSVAKHHIEKQLRRQRRMVSLDDLPPDSFVSEPDQETIASLNEIERIALDDQSKLTPGEKIVFKLWLKGWSDQQISEILEIKIASVQSEKSRMFRKIRQMTGRGKKRK